MARLLLTFEGKVLKEVPIGSRGISIGRSPDNDIVIDNLAVSNHHARVYQEAGKLVVEDLGSLNGTFLNDLRIERAALRDGDGILIGKHQVVVDQAREAAVPVSAGRKVSAPEVDETVVLDTRARREMLQQAVAAGERAQFAPERMRVPTLAVIHGKTYEKEYLLTNKLTVIGRSPMATVRVRGWFGPQVAAQISRPIAGPQRLEDGDIVEVGKVRLRFFYRD